MDTLVNDLVGNALRYLNIVNYDASIPGDLLQRGVESLNDILDEWSADQIFIPYQSVITLPLLSTQGNYTIGPDSSYDLNSNQIINIIDMVINDTASDGVDYKVFELEERYYGNIPYKKSSGIPTTYLLRNFVDYSELLFQPLPYSSSMSANIVCKQRLTEVKLGDTLSEIPRQYKLALKMKLCLLAGNIWGAQLSPQQYKTYTESLKKVLSSNSKSLDTTVKKTEMISSGNGVFFNWWVGS